MYRIKNLNSLSFLTSKSELKKLNIVFLLAPLFVFSQVTVTGKVKYSLGAIEFANVFLTNHENEIVTGIITDKNGAFEFSIEKGTYYLTISFIGYNAWKKEIILNESTDLGIINLIPDTNILKEVVVVSNVPVIEQNVDRLVFNVENSIYSKGVNGIELLRNTPRIEVTASENIKLIGKDQLKVMINGRLLNLSEEEVRQRLRSIRSENISKIEVISIPPAKYSAEGNSGLINIVLKEKLPLGIRGNVSSDYIQRDAASYTESLNINYRTDRLEAFLGGTFDDSKFVNSLFNEYTSLNQKINSDEERIFSSEEVYLNTILKYKLNKKMDIGITADFNNMTEKANTAEERIFKSSSNAIDSIIVSRGNLKDKSKTIAISAFTDYRLDSIGKQLNIAYNYSSHKTESQNNVTSTIDAQSERLRSPGDNDYNIHSLLADFELPLDFANLETGTSYTYINNYSELELFNEVSGEFLLDAENSNSFDYTENRIATYLSAQKELNKKWSLKIGLRYENTETKGLSSEQNLTNTSQSYGNLFPTFFTSYKPNDISSFSLGYSKRIQRPSFYNLNPFRYYSSNNAYSSGNSFLEPTITHNIELSYIFKNNLNITFSGSKLYKGVSFITAFSEEGISISSPQNSFDEDKISLHASYRINPFKWWKIQNSGSLYYANDKPSLPELQSFSGYGGSFRINNSFTLNKKKSVFAQLTYNQFLRSVNNLSSRDDFGYLSASIRFSLLDNNLNFFISALDIFKQNITTTTRLYDTFKNTTVSNTHLRNLLVSINYSFGNNKVDDVWHDDKNEDKSRAFK